MQGVKGEWFTCTNGAARAVMSVMQTGKAAITCTGNVMTTSAAAVEG